MKQTAKLVVVGLLALMLLAACEGLGGPDLSGEMVLSSHLHGTENYYLYGYHYEDGESYRYPSASDPLPDIINEGFLALGSVGLTSVPGFNSPGQLNGFALVGEFASAGEAREYYEGYSEVEGALQFEIISDTVRLNQVWVQLTSAGNYAKLLVKDIRVVEPEIGRIYNELSLDYCYQPDGSSVFEK